MILLMMIVLLLTSSQVTRQEHKGWCGRIAVDLKSRDPKVVKGVLQEILDEGCLELLPRVYEIFISGEAGALFYAA